MNAPETIRGNFSDTALVRYNPIQSDQQPCVFLLMYPLSDAFHCFHWSMGRVVGSLVEQGRRCTDTYIYLSTLGVRLVWNSRTEATEKSGFERLPLIVSSQQV